MQLEPKVMGEWTAGHYAMAVLCLLGIRDVQKIYSNIDRLDEADQRRVKKLIEQIPYMLNE